MVATLSTNGHLPVATENGNANSLPEQPRITSGDADSRRVWELLSHIKDPEIPVLSIADLGILRDVRVHGHQAEVVITPTYSGCPALIQIQEDIEKHLTDAGYQPTVTTQLAPPWTTEWISDAGRNQLLDYGIAPPLHCAAGSRGTADDPIRCPRCRSDQTTLVSEFGSTACKALYRCRHCQEPFDYFKCL